MTPSSAGSSADVSSVDGGDTESVHEDENSASDHESPRPLKLTQKLQVWKKRLGNQIWL